MYSKQEASLLRKNFWTKFGQYLKPLSGADGEVVNWLNYKTGIQGINFRMDANEREAGIAIEIVLEDSELREQYFKKFEEIKYLFEQIAGENWQWKHSVKNENGKMISKISKTINHVNVLDNTCWPAIISFLKPNILLLDKFWMQVKESFQ